MIDKSLLPNKEVYLWGAANRGFALLHRLRGIDIEPVAFLDSNPALSGTTHYGLRVIEPMGVLREFPGDAALIIVCTHSRGPMTLCGEAGLLEGKDYIHYSELDEPVRKPPRHVPPSLHDRFTMNGTIPVVDYYIDSSNPVPVFNTSETYKRVFHQCENRSMEYYGGHFEAFYDAFEKYPVRGKTVLVWGLDGCNCEAMSVYMGAKSTIVVDYNKPICLHENITVMTHRELAESGIKADSAISFSSFEHDGLGRYGDPIDPDGDVKAMRSARECLAPGGILFFGVPLGPDCVCWNAHRVYGRKRLPLMLHGWNCVDVFHPYGEKTSPLFPFDLTLGNYCQPLLILQNGAGGAVSSDAKTYATEDEAMLTLIRSMIEPRKGG